MVQPKTPPISIRLSADQLAVIDALAKRQGITRHAMILEAVEVGTTLIGSGGAGKPAAEPSKAAAKAIKQNPGFIETTAAIKRAAEPLKAPAATVPAAKVAKGAQRAPRALSVNVPYADDIVRPIYQRGSAKKR